MEKEKFYKMLNNKEYEELEKELKTELNASDQEGPLNKRKILIIEDDNDVREFLKEELTPYFEVAAEAEEQISCETQISE